MQRCPESTGQSRKRTLKLGLFSRYYHSKTKRGIAVYTRELTLALSGLIMDHDVTLIDYFWNKDGYSRLPVCENRRFKRGIIRFPGRLFEQLNAVFRWPKVESFHGPFDLLHVMHEYSAPASNHPNLVVTVHGLGPVLFPSYFEKDYRLKWQADLDRSLQCASLVIAVSDSLADQLCRFRPEFSHKYRSTPLGVADHFFADTNERSYRHVRSLQNIGFPFILYVGAFDKGKNLSTLLEAFSLCMHESSVVKPFHLVMVGNSRWGGCEELKEKAAQLKIAAKTHFLDYIDHDHLPALYRCCSLFVFPSLFEGFGLPVLEAMACGTPCLISNRPALDELGGDIAVLFDPASPADLAEKLTGLLENEEIREEMRQKGRRHAKKYTWKNTALETIRVYEHLLGAELTGWGKV